jgi:pteridine reductase
MEAEQPMLRAVEWAALAAGAGPRLTHDQMGRTALLTLIVLLIGFFGVLALTLLAIVRRRDRERQAREERLARESERTGVPVSAWEEAGRRMEPPPAEDPNDTRVPIDDEPSADKPRPTPSVRRERAAAPKRPVVLITGAARRVGRAIALEMARAGCDVQFTYNAAEDEAAQLARDLAEAGAEASFYRLDLGDEGAVESFARERADVLSELDVLIHNAAMYAPTPIAEFSAEVARRQFAVNALAPLVLTSRLAPALKKSGLPGGAAVVAVADIHAMGRPRREYSAYLMSKAALVQMVESLALDLAPRVRVNGIAPGVVAWPNEGTEAGPDGREKYLRRVPLGREGTPEDAARVVRWLALEATYVTGEVIRVDGGRWLT